MRCFPVKVKAKAATDLDFSLTLLPPTPVPSTCFSLRKVFVSFAVGTTQKRNYNKRLLPRNAATSPQAM